MQLKGLLTGLFRWHYRQHQLEQHSMNKQVIQDIITKLDMNAITLKDAKEFAKRFGMESKSRTKRQFIKDLTANQSI